jgi:hypothetical protein
MERTSVAIPWFCVVWLVFAACAEIPADNPYDPASPASVRQPGAVAGRLVLPAGYAAEGVTQSAITLSGNTPETTIYGPVPAGVDGAFRFSEVPSGAWHLRAEVSGFEPVERTALVALGQTIDLGALALRPATAVGYVVGEAHLGVAGADAIAPIDVEAEGTPYATRTASSGAFELALPAGTYRIAARSAGYGDARSDAVEVGVGSRVTLGSPLVLTALPAHLRARIIVLGLDGAPRAPGDALLGQVVVEYLPTDADVPPTSVPVGADGRIDVSGVAPGAYALRAHLAGHGSVFRPFDATPGAVVNLGELILEPALAGAEPAYVVGQVLLSGRDVHGDVVVEAADHLTATRTRADGTFRLQVVGDLPFSLSFTAPGFRPVATDTDTVAAGETRRLGDPIRLDFIPGGLTGRAVVRPAGLAPRPIDGGTASLTAGDGRPLGAVPVGADGVFAFADIPTGAHTLSLGGPRVRTTSIAALVPADTVGALGDVEVTPSTGSVQGALSVNGGPVPGEAIVVLEGAADDPWLAGIRLQTVVTPGTGGFEFGGVPIGPYRLTGLGPALRPTSVEVQLVPDETVTTAVDLTARRFRLVVPAATGDAVEVSFERDDDLVFAQVWVDTADPPADVPFAAILDGRPLVLPVQGEGPHVVHARLANAAWVDGGARAVEAFVTPTLSAAVVVDTSPPVLIDVLSDAPGGFVKDPDGRVRVTLICDDRPLAAGVPTARLERTGAPAIEGPASGSLIAALGPDEGPVELEALCRDAAGQGSNRIPVTLFVDHTPPTLRTLRVLDGRIGAATASAAAAVRIDAHDDGSGLEAYALRFDDALDCRQATYGFAAAPDIQVPLPADEGRHTLRACLRDRAGNAAGPFEANDIVVDRTPPRLAGLRLASGRDVVNALEVEVAVDGEVDEAGSTLLLSGDLEAPVDAPPGRWPRLLRLADEEGLHAVVAQVVDDAGNVSAPAVATVVVDRVPPAPGALRLAGGAQTVDTRVVDVSFLDTSADTYALVERADDAVCPPMPCGRAGDLPFAPSTTFVVSEGLGRKHLCWRLCDAAGNATAVREASVELGPYRPRPLPVLTAVDPIALTPFDCATPPDDEIRLTLTGRGIASGTVARVGGFTLPCEVPPSAVDCEADPDGGCGPDGPCAASCAQTCEVVLPPGVARASGTYLVRLVTPAPVIGLGESTDVRVFNIAAPQPRLLRMSRRHWIAVPDEDGFVEPETLTLDIEACGLMDNAQFSLGPNTARVLQVEPEPDDPRRSRARIEVSTAGITPDEAVDQWLVAENPAPGGGQTRARFGVLSPFQAGVLETVDTDLRVTRPPQSHGRGAELTLHVHGTVAAGSAWVGRRVAGADTLRLGALPPDESAFGELRLHSTLPATPAPPMDVSTMTFGRTTPSAGAFTVAPGTFIGGTGRFEPYDPVSARVGFALAGVRRVDFDRDGHMDLAVVTRSPSQCNIMGGAGNGLLESVVGRGCTVSRVLEDGTRDSGPPDALHVLDVDDDGRDDLLVVGTAGTALLRNVDGLLGAPEHPQIEVAPEVSQVAEVSGQRRPDLVVAADGRLHVFTFLLDGSLERLTETPLPGPFATATALALEDLDGDTHLDAALLLDDGDLVTFTGHGDGTFDQARRAPAHGGGGDRLMLFDLDGDGLRDALHWATGDDAVFVTWNDGRGRLGPAIFTLPVPDGIEDLVVEDPDVDGRPDLIVIDAAGAVARHRFDRRVHQGPLDVGIDPGGPGGGWRLATGDLNDDGAVDLIRLNGIGGVGIDLGIGRGTSGFMETAERTGAGRVVPALADMDGDGIVDLVVASLGVAELPGQLQVRRGDGSGRFPVETLFAQLPDARYTDVELVDADADGDLDVFATTLDGFLVLGVNDGTGWLESLPIPLNTPLNGLTVFGRPGAPVLFITEGDRARVRSLSISFAAGRWTAGNLPMTDHPGRYIMKVVSLDVDRDGYVDQVVCVDGIEGLQVAHYSPVTMDFSRRSVIPTRSGPCFDLEVGDFDGDGRGDLAVSDDAGPFVLYGAPAGGFTVGEFIGETENVTGMMRFADLNGDGRGDWLTGNVSGVTYRLGLGNRRFLADRAPTSPLATPAWYSAVADLNGDGVRDVVWGGSGAYATVWLRQSTRLWPFSFRGVVPGRPVELPAGGAVTELGAEQFQQLIQSLSVRVRIEGTNLDALSLTLVSPRGESMLLDGGAGHAGETVWQASYPTVAPAQSLDGLLGMQPQGRWTLRVQNRGAARARIADFTVLTVGAFQL